LADSNNQNKRVFISYAREDLEVAKRLYNYLKAVGLEPWLDRESLLPGQKWKGAIKDAIQNCRYFIPLLSSNSVEGRGFVQRELKEALEVLDEFPSNDIFVIPSRLNNCRVFEDKLNELHIVDLFPDWNHGVEKILKAMKIQIESIKDKPNPIMGSGSDELTINLLDVYWNQLIRSILQKKCIPFIGPGAASFTNQNEKRWIPLGRQIAREMIKDNEKSFENSDLAQAWIEGEEGESYLIDEFYQLARVSQFLALESGDEKFPKLYLSDLIGRINPPDFYSEKENTSYAVLADLDLPIYVTTNYDLLMEEALRSRSRGKKDPVSGFCRWNDKLAETPLEYDRRYKPTESRPFVYHLHGYIDKPESMVLTERDYFDFVIYLNKEKETDIHPSFVITELPRSSLLFIGYNIQDINFRSIFQGALSFIGGRSQTISVAVQIPPILDNNKKSKIIKYLDHYTKEMFDIHAYWGNLSDFVTDFRQRFNKYASPKEVATSSIRQF
jgi:hypothetical protein